MKPVPTYTFKLRDGRGGVEDATGVVLSNRDSALRYAHGVVHELMRSREAETRSWCLDVFERGAGESPVCEIPFASLDPSLDHLEPDSRAMLESASEHQRLLSEAIHRLEETIRESRALIARAHGKPYLASRFGKAIIRDI